MKDAFFGVMDNCGSVQGWTSWLPTYANFITHKTNHIRFRDDDGHDDDDL